MAEMSPDSKRSPRCGAVRVEHRLSRWARNALDAVRDSKMMRNLKTIREAEGHGRGRGDRAPRGQDREGSQRGVEKRGSRRATPSAAAPPPSGLGGARRTRRDRKTASRVCLRSRTLKSPRSAPRQGAEAAARALAEARRVDHARRGWRDRRRHGGEGATVARERRARRRIGASVPTKPLARLARANRQIPNRASRRGDGHSRFRSLTESVANEEDTETSFFGGDVSVAVTARGARQDGSRRRFLEPRMWGGDGFDADGEIGARRRRWRSCAPRRSQARGGSASGRSDGCLQPRGSSGHARRITKR